LTRTLAHSGATHYLSTDMFFQCNQAAYRLEISARWTRSAAAARVHAARNTPATRSGACADLPLASFLCLSDLCDNLARPRRKDVDAERG